MKSVFYAFIAFAAGVALGSLLNVKHPNINMGKKQSIRGLRHHHSMDFGMEGRVRSFQFQRVLVFILVDSLKSSFKRSTLLAMLL
jgi:hypothetical protein